MGFHPDVWHRYPLVVQRLISMIPEGTLGMAWLWLRLPVTGSLLSNTSGD
ncbi:hypothetical protein [Myxococcus sp. CA039A]|nr:hypothetical protein [Myxococcus sp. CA039A]NTX50085.1 hypothetical protein [Myxococcus sp. CA039A]